MEPNAAGSEAPTLQVMLEPKGVLRDLFVV